MSSSYSDDTVRTKLSALNDSQDAIVAVAQWIMFHRRQAKRSTELWFERLKESSPHRKLMLIYLANEIVQQSKARNRPEFGNAFAVFIVEGSESAYRGCPPDIQNRIRRVVQVWRERNIFKPDTQAEIEQKFDDIDKGNGSEPSKGGSLKLGSGFLSGRSPDVPLEFVPLLKSHKEINEKTSSVTIAIGSANTEFQKQFNAEHLPAAPVYAARLSSLLKTLDTANVAVKSAIEARNSHIRNIERLLEQSKSALIKDEQVAMDIAEKLEKAVATKASVEHLILEGMEDIHGTRDGVGSSGEKTPEDLKSPEIEALTPPLQVGHLPGQLVRSDELPYLRSCALADPPHSHPPEFHTSASELLASLSGHLLNGVGLKRPTPEDTNVFEGIDEDLVHMFKNQFAQPQLQKRQKLETRSEDDYVP
ncbi:RNA polymerase II-binding domain-containing protein [Trichophaea hybrida]|nr:RNA polymerase II-binding domain-containing protein [Trichophaea hybrida]